MKYQGGLPRLPGGSAVDYREDFFGRPSYLTVSGQLQVSDAEMACRPLSDIRTQGSKALGRHQVLVVRMR